MNRLCRVGIAHQFVYNYRTFLVGDAHPTLVSRKAAEGLT
jgi:hypothetical protein